MLHTQLPLSSTLKEATFKFPLAATLLYLQPLALSAIGTTTKSLRPVSGPVLVLHVRPQVSGRLPQPDGQKTLLLGMATTGRMCCCVTVSFVANLRPRMSGHRTRPIWWLLAMRPHYHPRWGCLACKTMGHLGREHNIERVSSVLYNAAAEQTLWPAGLQAVIEGTQELGKPMMKPPFFVAEAIHRPARCIGPLVGFGNRYHFLSRKRSLLNNKASVSYVLFNSMWTGPIFRAQLQAFTL